MTIAVLGILAVFSAVFLSKNIDFAVYWHGVRGFMSAERPLYGPHSGIGYPQEFRYPPVTVLFFLPLVQLPLRLAGILWVVMAWGACAWAAAVAIGKWRLRFTRTSAALAVLLLAQYVVLFVKFGNVQPFLIALVLLTLLWSEEHPGWAGTALGVAICFKVWPVFFVPWLLMRRRRATLYYAVGASAVLWTLPVLFFGSAQYTFLLHDFYSHVAALASSPESVWYSSQSLRGVLFRFFTRAAPPRDGYPDVSIASLAPSAVSACCLLLTILVYGYAVIAMWRARPDRRYLWDAAAFVFFSILQPFCMNSGLISLLPAILVAAHVYSSDEGKKKGVRPAFLTACGLMLVALATFYRPLQREALMLGIDFWIMVALGTSLVLAAQSRTGRSEEAPSSARLEGKWQSIRPTFSEKAASRSGARNS